MQETEVTCDGAVQGSTMCCSVDAEDVAAVAGQTSKGVRIKRIKNSQTNKNLCKYEELESSAKGH